MLLFHASQGLLQRDSTRSEPGELDALAANLPPGPFAFHLDPFGPVASDAPDLRYHGPHKASTPGAAVQRCRQGDAASWSPKPFFELSDKELHINWASKVFETSFFEYFESFVLSP